MREKKKSYQTVFEKMTFEVEKSAKLAYFGLSGLNLRPLERFNRIHLYSQSKLPQLASPWAIRKKVIRQFLRKLRSKSKKGANLANFGKKMAAKWPKMALSKI